MPALAEPRRRPRLFESDGFDQWADEGNMDASKVLHPLCLHTPSYTEADPFPPKFWKESASIMKGASSGIRGRMSAAWRSSMSSAAQCCRPPAPAKRPNCRTVEAACSAEYPNPYVQERHHLVDQWAPPGDRTLPAHEEVSLPCNRASWLDGCRRETLLKVGD
jgi:hypothetical protein